MFFNSSTISHLLSKSSLMSIYIVVNENFYGGDSAFIKAFRSSLDADHYVNTQSTELNLDVISLSFRFVPSSNSTSLSIVVSEDWYGGGYDHIRIFTSNSDAQNYCDSLPCESLTCGPEVITCDIPLI